MIPVAPQPEPAGFDQMVRQPGRRWMQGKGIDTTLPLPKGTKLDPCWRKCLPELYRAYGGICAYVSIHIPRTTGAKSVDHFVAKSSEPAQAYEWSNFRLASSKMNGQKNVFEDVLDPFTLNPETFHLNLFDGAIRVNSKLSGDAKTAAQATIDRLGLDDEDCREDRRDYFDDYRRNNDETVLKRKAPFVWYEAQRQGLL
jgi:uncharacterized protein (TIGR02646 family)